MPTPINILKEWFSTLKKPTQAQFWAWMDSIRFKGENIPTADIIGLDDKLLKKADLIDGVVPENQLPFSVQTSEIIAIGTITTSTNAVNLAVHSSGSNKVRIKGKNYERAFPNTFSYAAVVNYIKILILYAVPDSNLFYLAEGMEASEAEDPDLPSGAVPIKKITVNLNGQVVEDYSAEFTSIADKFDIVNDRINTVNDDLLVEERFRELQVTNLQSEIDAEIVNRAIADNLKLDKPTANNTSEFAINGDGTTSPKSNNQRNKQFFVSLPATVLEDWKGCMVFFTSTGTLTIPSGLTSDFTFNGILDKGVTLTPAITSPMAFLGTTPTAFSGVAIFTMVRRDGTNNFQILGV